MTILPIEIQERGNITDCRYHYVTINFATEPGNLHRGLCPACGSPVGAKSDTFPDIWGVSAARMDGPSGLEPVADIWTASTQPGDDLHPHFPKSETQPPPEDFQALLAARG